MRHVVFMSALLGLSLIQCSSEDKKGPKYPDATSFCVALGQAECSTAVVNSCLVSSKEVCAAQRQTVCTSTYVTPAQSQGLTYDAAQAETCVNAVSSAYTDIQITNAEKQSISAACGAVFSRMGAKGASCTIDSDCKRSDGLQCVIHAAAQSAADAGGEADGTCQVPQQLEGGKTCSAPDAVCATGYHCGSTSHCDQDEAKGNSCSVADPCETGSLCTAGTCVGKLAIGADCTTDDECADGICLEDVNLCADKVNLTPNESFCVDVRS